MAGRAAAAGRRRPVPVHRDRRRRRAAAARLTTGARPWSDAWHDALYGPAGFYRRPEGPAASFRTASHAAPDLLAVAVARLAAAAGCTRVVDVGAGGGELLAALARLDVGLGLDAVDVAARPSSLPVGIGWHQGVPSPLDDTLLVGWELLDVVPCGVAEADADGRLRVVLVSPDGSEQLGSPVPASDLAWCDRWWPGPWPVGDRVEVGAPRDTLWRDVVGALRSGLALAVDYDHVLGARPAGGSLAGFRAGRAVPPVPDGSCDVTAHVALDAVADAVGGVVVRQRDAVRQLGVRADRPPVELARTDPTGYVRALAAAGSAAALRDPGGLGGFGWLLTPRGPRGAAAVRSVTTTGRTSGLQW